MRGDVLTKMEASLQGYFFIDRVPKIRTAVEANRVRLVAIQDPDAFADAVTRVLYAASHDKHLAFFYSPEVLRQFKKPTSADIVQMDRMDSFADYWYDVSARLHGNIGYLWIDAFSPSPSAAAIFDHAMALLAKTDALIVDLRGNGGGSIHTVDYFLGYFFSKPIEVTGFTWRRDGKISKQRAYTAPVKGPLYLNKPVYVLIDDQTISGGEQVAYDLQGTHRAELIGVTTAGGANPGGQVRLDDHFSVFIPEGSAHSPYTGTNWEGTGVHPDVDSPSKAALLRAYVRALKTATDPLGFSAEARAEALKNPAKALSDSLPQM
jgi:C-terminal processing protease CtpA/Prc